MCVCECMCAFVDLLVLVDSTLLFYMQETAYEYQSPKLYRTQTNSKLLSIQKSFIFRYVNRYKQQYFKQTNNKYKGNTSKTKIVILYPKQYSKISYHKSSTQWQTYMEIKLDLYQ